MNFIAVGDNDRVTAKVSAVTVTGLNGEEAERQLVMATIKIPVDFNVMNEDSSLRLNTRGALEALNEQGIKLHEGMEVLIEDRELWARARVCLRHGIWSAEIVGNLHCHRRWIPVSLPSEDSSEYIK